MLLALTKELLYLGRKAKWDGDMKDYKREVQVQCEDCGTYSRQQGGARPIRSIGRKAPCLPRVLCLFWDGNTGMAFCLVCNQITQ